jgi:hypothetical protein
MCVITGETRFLSLVGCRFFFTERRLARHSSPDAEVAYVANGHVLASEKARRELCCATTCTRSGSLTMRLEERIWVAPVLLQDRPSCFTSSLLAVVVLLQLPLRECRGVSSWCGLVVGQTGEGCRPGWQWRCQGCCSHYAFLGADVADVACT